MGKTKASRAPPSAWLPGRGRGGWRWRARGLAVGPGPGSWPRAVSPPQGPKSLGSPQASLSPQQGQGGGGPLAEASTPVSEPTGASLGLWKHGPPKPVGVTSPPRGLWEKRRPSAHRQGVPGLLSCLRAPAQPALPLRTPDPAPLRGVLRSPHITSEEAAAQGADGLPALCTFSSK